MTTEGRGLPDSMTFLREHDAWPVDERSARTQLMTIVSSMK